MSNIFKKFEGLKVRVQIVNGFGLPVDRCGYVETEENWGLSLRERAEGQQILFSDQHHQKQRGVG